MCSRGGDIRTEFINSISTTSRVSPVRENSGFHYPNITYSVVSPDSSMGTECGLLEEASCPSPYVNNLLTPVLSDMYISESTDTSVNNFSVVREESVLLTDEQ